MHLECERTGNVVSSILRCTMNEKEIWEKTFYKIVDDRSRQSKFSIKDYSSQVEDKQRGLFPLWINFRTGIRKNFKIQKSMTKNQTTSNSRYLNLITRPFFASTRLRQFDFRGIKRVIMQFQFITIITNFKWKFMTEDYRGFSKLLFWEFPSWEHIWDLIVRWFWESENS